MYPYSQRARAAVTIVTAVVLTVLTVVVPLLDRGQAPGPVAFATESSAPGVLDHHHGICLQHGAAAWMVGSGAEAPSSIEVRADDALPVMVRAATATAVPLHLPRAPPAV